MIVPAQLLRAANSFLPPHQNKLPTEGKLGGYLGESKVWKLEKCYDTVIQPRKQFRGA